MQHSSQNQIDTQLLQIDSLADLGVKLASCTDVKAGELAVLFDVIEEKASWLYDQLNRPVGKKA